MRLAGHTLRYEGQPFVAPICSRCAGDPDHRSLDNHGHGKCSCGEYGPCDDTDAARQRWHRDHKFAVRAAQINGGAA